ncbi:ATP-dependent nuclease [Legionella maceachernii]|uniref:ATPase AAA-type core domain-containing protein n=1 Tax=Legionella maceachernii TaxID=466 RepID=A0A0W0VWM4_9GAMM|nr:AAA family ATPase [Legionella maceachernii]KTD24656.1 hypothetical protein Lmac_2743 [Legionella maceachernii]SKA26757.1 AAA domain-containing protein, putative AbiEii toxin, Type IV TA system [Legionella maceachernii]SUP01840.1 Predicted ATPase [Legionella maceachernii]
MNYTKFSISDFRCFSQEQSLWFGIPVADKIGSGITYIVGSNSSGKTTLIEGLWINEQVKIRSSEKRTHSGPRFCLYDIDENLNREVSLLREDSYTLKEDPKVPPNELFEIISSRRHWQSTTAGEQLSSAVLDTTRELNPRNQQNNIATANILKDIEKDSEKYEQFTALVKRVIPEFTKWAVAYEENEYIEYTSSEGIKHKTDFLGDGVISIIRILAHLFEPRTSGIIIDEPELSLHPLAQKKLIKLIAEYAQNRQIIISTHSPYFVSWEYIQNGAVLNRVAKINDTSSKIYTIKDFNKYKKLTNGSNWQQPYLMDIVSREIFFQDNILFVEGQEDVGLLENELKDKDINFFGYGVRGIQNFEFAFQLAKDLGIKKACVLIDSPSDPAVGEENKVKEVLEKKFKSYKVVQWERTDIRDKPAQTKPAKEKLGYFTAKGIKKKDEELGDFYNKIEQIIDFFKN